MADQGPPPSDAKDEKFQKVWEKVQRMTPQQRREVQQQAMDNILRRTRVDIDGKPSSLRRLVKRVEAQRKLFESGAFDPTTQNVPLGQLKHIIPGDQIRQGAYKMQLRPWEEAELELDRYGHGNVFSPHPVLGMLRGGRRDFAWAVYARSDAVESVLGEDWAGQDPNAAVRTRDLYVDVMKHCHNMELTLMVIPSRRLPLAATRQMMAEKLERSMQSITGSEQLEPKQKAELADFVSAFADERVAPAGWMDRRGCVKEGTHFIFSTTKDAQLMVEAITPGRLKDRRTSRITVNDSPLVTCAVFESFLGQDSLDEIGKQNVGNGMLWVANGFRFRPWEAREGQVLADERPDGSIAFPPPPVIEEVDLPLRPSMFELLEQQTQPFRRMLLGGVRQARQLTQQAGG